MIPEIHHSIVHQRKIIQEKDIQKITAIMLHTETLN